jgi:MFS family permease
MKFGRKPNVLVGIGLLALGCFLIYIMGVGQKPGALIYVCFVILGIGWALINVNSYPMMVEMSTSSEIGKYTGLYYTFSMVAQSITPILVGFLITIRDKYDILFIYSLVAMVISFTIFYFFKENKKKIEKKSALEAFDE